MMWTTQPRSKTNGIAYVSQGNGPRLLLFHGVGLRSEAWNAQIDALSGRFEVLAADMPGHGESECLPADANLADFGNCLAEFLDRPTVVAGHSMGALIALDLATRYPDRIQGVAALNAIFRRTDTARAAVWQRAGDLDGITAVNPEPTLARWFGPTHSPEREACGTWLRSMDPAGYRTAYRIFAAEDGPTEQLLRSLPCPALFLTGGLEPNSTPAMSQAMADLASEGQIQVIETAAHMMPMTHPKTVTAAMQRFIEGCLK